MSITEHADLFTALAEALSDPSEWICLPGREWPLFELASRLLPNSSALPGMALIPAEALHIRQDRYVGLSKGQAGKPNYWLSESAYLSGSILGHATFEVAKCYAKAGLEVEGSELPDSASNELAFLAWLARINPDAEEDFLKHHAGRWLPGLGQSLARGTDQVYAAVGQILSDWMTHVLQPNRVVKSDGRNHLPELIDPEACNLCGFCVQRCQTQAMAIQETVDQTALELIASRCTGCGRCIAACDASLLKMKSTGIQPQSSQVLRISERLVCKKCGQPMVSRAEMDYVMQQLGHLAWLEYCLDCRIPAYSRSGAKK